MAPGASAAHPDLVADPPGSPYLDQDSAEAGGRLLVRFDGYVHNMGAGPAGPLEVRGTGGSSGLMGSVQQWIDPDDLGLPGATIRFENTDGHNHWHLMSAARYSLWKGDRSQEVAPAHKVGFCLLDSQLREGSAPATYTGSCKQGQQSASTVSMGLSPGWRDVYSAATPLQWVDASNVAPGSYVISSEVDPDNLIREANESNPRNWAGSATTIPGHVAGPVAAGQISQGGGQVTLQATTVGGAGSRQFKVVDAPDHGTLSRSTNTPFSDPTLTYIPSPGYGGPDSFRYVALDGSSPFPLNPPSAAVTLSVAPPPPGPGPGPDPDPIPPTVAISGVPAGMYAGTSAQLSASVIGGPPHVTWKVNGIPGGTGAIGLIDSSGLYTAPWTPPPGGSVEVSATSDDGETDSARIQIMPLPPATPAPSVTTPALRGAMSAVAAKRHRGELVVKLVPGYSGRLKIVVRHGTKRVSSRRIKATRRRAVTARFRLPRAYRGRLARRLRVTVALRSTRGKIVAVRRARVR